MPAKDHAPGSKRPIFRQDGEYFVYPRSTDSGRAASYQPVENPVHDQQIIGYIPQVPHTYALWEGEYSHMNEHGLALGESTCSGALVGVGVHNGGTALFTVANLMQVALERCKTCRCAVETMGSLAEAYGFFGEDPGLSGAGEIVTVADAAGDAWVFHVTGGVANRTGALWVAQRVPEEHVAVVANSFTIKNVDLTDTASFAGSSNLLEDAKIAGMWDGRGTFNWQKAMSPDYNVMWQANANAMDPLRMWRVFTLANPSLDLKPSDFLGDFPFSVKPVQKVSKRDVMNWHRDTFDGTEFDMTLGTVAGPWQSPRRFKGGEGVGKVSGQFGRPISMFWTLYCILAQPAVKHPVLWFAPDMAKSSVFVPFYSEVLRGNGRFSEKDYGQGSQLSFSFSSPNPVWWAFNLVSNWMELSYRNMSQTYVFPKVHELQQWVLLQAQRGEEDVDADESNIIALLADLQTGIQQQVSKEWWSLAEMLIVRYNDQFFNFPPHDPTNSADIGYPAFWLQMVGFNQRSYYPVWSEPSQRPPSLLFGADMEVAQHAAAARASCRSMGSWQSPSCAKSAPGSLRLADVAPASFRQANGVQDQWSVVRVGSVLCFGCLTGVIGFLVGSARLNQAYIADKSYLRITD